MSPFDWRLPARTALPRVKKKYVCAFARLLFRREPGTRNFAAASEALALATGRSIGGSPAGQPDTWCLGYAQWERTARFTEWASEFLSGPLRAEDFCGYGDPWRREVSLASHVRGGGRGDVKAFKPTLRSFSASLPSKMKL